MRHAPTAATRAAAFGADEPVDERGLEAAAALRLPQGWPVLSSPALRCRQTASAARLGSVVVEPALAECDFGAWAGLALADIDACPHGGESLRSFAARVAAWLDLQARLPGRAIAVTHGGVVKAAVVHALGAPLRAFWQIDAAPLSITELHAHDGRWTVACVNRLAAERVVRDADAGRGDRDRAGAAR